MSNRCGSSEWVVIFGSNGATSHMGCLVCSIHQVTFSFSIKPSRTESLTTSRPVNMSVLFVFPYCKAVSFILLSLVGTDTNEKISWHRTTTCNQYRSGKNVKNSYQAFKSIIDISLFGWTIFSTSSVSIITHDLISSIKGVFYILCIFFYRTTGYNFWITRYLQVLLDTTV